MSFKRNQIEEAIARIFYPDRQKLPSELRTRIKRLLELDRSMGRKRGSKDTEEANFGFFSEEAPGTGAVISFSEYEAFALLNGLARLATGLRSFNHAPRPSRSRKGARADPSAMSGQAFRSASDTLKSPPRRYRSRQYDPVFLTIAPKKRRAADEGGQPRYPLCAKEWSRSANSVAI